MYPSENILEGARSIRPYLPKLLNSPEAEAIDHQLAELLMQAQQGQSNIDNKLLEVLTSTEPTREFTVKFLNLSPVERITYYYPIPGDPTPISGLVKYACTFGDYVWYQRQKGQPIPNCPTHNVPLEKA
ncbi:MAG: hypothetical protein AB4426_27665 [Xenococcaceae cyanobacterium]